MNQQPKTVQTIILIAILALVLVVISSSLLTQNSGRLAYSDVLDLFETERVESFVLQGDTLTLTLYGSDAEQAGTATAKIGDIETFHKDLDETIAAQSAAGALKSYNYLPAANSIWKTALPYALIIGGALGNVIDRLIHGHVIDFIKWYVGDHVWPAFNLADAAIVGGAIGLVVFSLFGGKKDSAAGK